ncbi:hypothetical protein D9758_007197 [Tetrapyrgos nigripes]|uniref:DUF914-domain-containing protein n=1 Tax=Tetrapyrgos nigripes TaxID=182062 RepID=A0A8H5D2G7_9AGAR|nr:hypothetical protein D9758_007197 [Tetrapyrgos nigripes]
MPSSASLHQDFKDSAKDHVADVESLHNVVPKTTPRPPIRYSSPAAFVSSVGERFKSVWTKRFALSLLAGQLVSLCITCTNVTTTELVQRNWALSTTQSVFLYFSLFMIYTPFTIYKYGFKGWAEVIFKDGWKYFILAACDVEGNFMVVKAYQYTDLLSCMLLDAFMGHPSLLILLMGVHAYKIPVDSTTRAASSLPSFNQIVTFYLQGVFICIIGLGLLVTADVVTDKNFSPVDRGKGDAFMVAGATLYGFTNATEEFLVRRRPLYEVVGQLGMWGFMICAIQAASLEHAGMHTATWNGATVGLILAYTAAMFILYTVAPILYRMASSGYYNLSLLSSDFYGLLFGLFLFHYSPYWLYFIAFAVVLCGLITYFWSSAPEEQGELNPQAPEYVQAKRENLRGPQSVAGNV